MNWLDKIIIAAILILLAVLLAPKANAVQTMFFQDGNGNAMLLLQEPCKAGPYFKGWQKGLMTWEGRQLEACWRIQGSAVVVIDAEGDVTPIPMDAFRPKETI